MAKIALVGGVGVMKIQRITGRSLLKNYADFVFFTHLFFEGVRFVKYRWFYLR